jgi:hypothetical protein
MEIIVCVCVCVRERERERVEWNVFPEDRGKTLVSLLLNIYRIITLQLPTAASCTLSFPCAIHIFNRLLDIF